VIYKLIGLESVQLHINSTARTAIKPDVIFTHKSKYINPYTRNGTIITSSPQPVTVRPCYLSQCLLSPVCISHGVALQLRVSSSPLRPQCCSDHTFLFQDFLASHSVLTRKAHTDSGGVQRGSPEHGGKKMTQ